MGERVVSDLRRQLEKELLLLLPISKTVVVHVVVVAIAAMVVGVEVVIVVIAFSFRQLPSKRVPMHLSMAWHAVTDNLLDKLCP